jgi:hypothetical protein
MVPIAAMHSLSAGTSIRGVASLHNCRPAIHRGSATCPGHPGVSSECFNADASHSLIALPPRIGTLHSRSWRPRDSITGQVWIASGACPVTVVTGNTVTTVTVRKERL